MPATLEPTKAERREAKRLARLERDHDRRLEGWEQYRALWDGIDFKRQLINMNDKKVRFALVIMAALNAVVLLAASRTPLHAASGPLRAVLGVVVVAYAVVTFWFMHHAVEALRPRPEARRDDDAEWRAREGADGGGPAGRAPGFWIRGALRDVAYGDECRLWREARLADLNAELVLFNRTSSAILMRQVEQVAKAYAGLKLLVLLGGLLLALLMGGGMAREGAATTAALVPSFLF